jgi:hypothetical protein
MFFNETIKSGINPAGRPPRSLSGLLSQSIFNLIRILGLIEKCYQDVGAFARECDGNRAADTAVAAGDDGLRPLQPARALVTSLTADAAASLRLSPAPQRGPMTP